MSVRILRGDMRDTLLNLHPKTVQCAVTSPPYWQQRVYTGLPEEIGLEPTLSGYVDALVYAFRLVHRLLKDDGTLWLNLGDSYNAYNGNRGASKSLSSKRDAARPTFPKGYGLTEKTLGNKQRLMIPARVALALQADGWVLRSEIIWAKAVSFCPDYVSACMPSSAKDRPTDSHETVYLFSKAARYKYQDTPIKMGGLGLKTVWAIPASRKKSKHPAVFPEALAEACILAGTAPGDAVLDPFSGSGTTGRVAERLGRPFIGCELQA